MVAREHPKTDRDTFQAMKGRGRSTRATAPLTKVPRAAMGISHAQSERISGLTAPRLGGLQEASVQLKLDGQTASTDQVVQMDDGSSWLDLAVQMIAPEPVSKTSAIHEMAQAGVQGAGGELPYLDRIQTSFGGYELAGTSAFVGGKGGQMAKQMGARAYTVGDRVAFKEEPSLHTAAHEAAHVIQQRTGVSLEGDVGKPGDPYEQHADAVADRVVQGESAEDLLSAFH